MNVRCPSCGTLYRVDPTKVPAEGVQARCAECPAVIAVTHPVSGAQPAAIPERVVEELPPIPKVPGIEIPVVEEASSPPKPVIPETSAVSEATPPAVSPIVSYSDSVLDLPAHPGNGEKPLVPHPPLPEVPDLDLVPPVPEGPSEQVGVVDGLPPVPDVPATAEPELPVDIRLPAPASAPEPEGRPPLEVVPGPDGKPAAGGRRYTRPFIRPPESPEAPREPAPAQPPPEPLRPTAPVFRPTPGMPVQPPAPEPPPVAETPPAHPAPPARSGPVSPTAELPTQAAPSEPPAAPEPIVIPEPAPKRPVNPFLSKDPKQKARRLARALVSDMIVYQPQKRQDALAAGTLKESFDEEIRKSWAEYVEQVGQELAQSTDYFKEALNDILAGGNEVF